MSNTRSDRVRRDLVSAATVVAPQWPLSSTVAVNPLAGFEDRWFDEALHDAALLFGARGRLTDADYRAAFAAGRITLDALEESLRGRYPDLDGATISAEAEQILAMDGFDADAPRRQALTVAEHHDLTHGTMIRAEIDLLISDWCARWSTDPDAGGYWDGWCAEHQGGWPTDPAEALVAALDHLRVPGHDHRSYLERHLTALPGWVAHLRWRDEPTPGDLLGHVAACVSLEAELVDPRAGRSDAFPWWYTSDGPPLPTPNPGVNPLAVWHDAYERVVHDQILSSITAVDDDQQTSASPLAQVVCCIDVRSEGLRRQLEACGPYETFGYAGFFGLAATMTPFGATPDGPGASDQCPVIVSPEVSLTEVATGEVDDQHLADHELARLRATAAIEDGWRAAKYHPVAPLALAEAAGWVLGPAAAVRTAAPGLAGWIADHLPTGRRSRARSAFDRSALSTSEQAEIVAGILRLGRSEDAGRSHLGAPLVILCGHTSTSDNNPLESGLACGACGGHSGASNARAVAAMANDPQVRQALADAGLALPATTWFLAAEHNTATDVVEVLDRHLVPAPLTSLLSQLRVDLSAAGDAAASDRVAALPGAGGAGSRLRQVRRRNRDWAEPVAELGQAGNAAFVVGPRARTRGVDLGRRVFLHSYEPSLDPDGATLKGILTAPLVVAQWINAQYYFSTTDPEVFGAGSKTVHNVLGDVGVLTGPGGDLRRGLPLQSVRAGDRLLHEPVRLLTVVEGNLDLVDAAIDGSVVLQQLVHNEWILLVARPEPGVPFRQRTQTGWHDRPLLDATRQVAA